MSMAIAAAGSGFRQRMGYLPTARLRHETSYTIDYVLRVDYITQVSVVGPSLRWPPEQARGDR
jgi:hypothetical protein